MFVVPPLPHVKIITLLGKFSLLKTDKPIKMILKSKKKCCFHGKKNNVNKHKKVNNNNCKQKQQIIP